MNILTLSFILLILGVIPYSWIIHEYVNTPRIKKGKPIKKLLVLQRVLIVMQIAFGLTALSIQAYVMFNS